MKPSLLVIVIALLLITGVVPAADPPATVPTVTPATLPTAPTTVPPDYLATSRTVAQDFSVKMRNALQQALQSSGPVSSIAVCRDQAPQIAANILQATGIQVARTSLKARNPRNAPDEWELLVLRDFEARQAAGAAPDSLEFHEVVVQGGQATFRYMKAISTTSLCLVCHGDNLTPDLRAALQQYYPTDAAYGFREGDLRGALSLKRPL